MKLTLPAAVLLGLMAAGAFVAAAIVYTAPRDPVSVSPTSTGPQYEAAKSPPTVATASMAIVTSAASAQPVDAQLERQVAKLANSCWANAKPNDTMKGAVNLAFDMHGSVLHHGVKEALPRDSTSSGRPSSLPHGHGDVLACIDSKLDAVHPASACFSQPHTAPNDLSQSISGIIGFS